MQLFKFPIIPVSKMTLMNGELARMCIQIHLLQTRCIKRFHRTVLLRSKKIRNDKSKSFYQIFFSFSILRNKI